MCWPCSCSAAVIALVMGRAGLAAALTVIAFDLSIQGIRTFLHHDHRWGCA